MVYRGTDLTFEIPSSKPRRAFGRKSVASDYEKGAVNDSALPKSRNLIISGVSGEVRQGEYVGLLGASGAGKTTLLNILSGRYGSSGTVKGSVSYREKPRDPTTWKHSVGYVEQDDAMLPRLTVKETIEYAAKLRLPSKRFTAAEKMDRVDEIMDMLRVQKCANQRIGSQNERGVSGGERKRASIGIVSSA